MVMLRGLIACGAIVLVLLLAVGQARAADRDACHPMLPASGAAPQAARVLDAMDLASLSDIGPSASIGPTDRLLTLSPDHRWAAFQLRRGVPRDNLYCLAMVVVDLWHRVAPVVVDRGGQLIQISMDVRGIAAIPSGIPRPISPRWSRDGRWIAFLKRVHGVTRLWRAERDGSGSQALTGGTDDVVDFRFSPDGRSILFITRPGLRHAASAIQEEAASGYLYDARFLPAVAPHPWPLAGDPRRTSVLTIASGAIATASAEQADWLRSRIAATAAGRGPETSVDGRRASLMAAPGDIFGLDLRIEVATGGQTTRCDAPACRGRLLQLWWTADGRRLRYLRLEGWGAGETAIYEWDPAAGRPRRLFSTQDQLTDCTAFQTRILCLDDGAITPRRSVAIDPDSRRTEVVFDPNPSFPTFRLGRVERLEWKNRFGLETFGDLVFPVGYQPGRRYPLIVVQYNSRGFLRGGTGDEYPIQAFAGRGYAVLSFQRPLDIGIVRAPRSIRAAQALDQKAFADRRNVLSSLERGVRMIIARGIADRRRIGLTGMSDGAATVQYALLHSHLFAVAALSNCCIDGSTAMLSGPAAARHFLEEGFPPVGRGGNAFWRQIALGPNARRVTAPILLQLPSDEYLDGLETYSGLQAAGRPVMLYVFPGEHHVKWQPAHRLAVYQRSLDWFDYWLKPERSLGPERARDLALWRNLPMASRRRPPGP